MAKGGNDSSGATPGCPKWWELVAMPLYDAGAAARAQRAAHEDRRADAAAWREAACPYLKCAGLQGAAHCGKCGTERSYGCKTLVAFLSSPQSWQQAALPAHSRYVDPDARRVRDVNNLVARTIIMSTGRR